MKCLIMIVQDLRVKDRAPDVDRVAVAGLWKTPQTNNLDAAWVVEEVPDRDVVPERANLLAAVGVRVVDPVVVDAGAGKF